MSDDRSQLVNLVERWIETSRRGEQTNPGRYWYPLSLSTYGVEEVVEAIDSMCNFRTSMGDKTRQFERQFATEQGSSEAVMVNSGSSADLLLCHLLINPLRPLLAGGDEILVPAVTWPTQVWSPLMAGLRVRLVDVDPATLNIDIDDLQAKITPATKALFLVHLMGNPCAMDAILPIAHRHELLILEDCCEALGAEWDGVKVGNFGIGGSFSFFFSHHITTMEGGMIVCQSRQVAEQLRILRAHGWLRNVDQAPYDLARYDVDPRYAFVNWGFNVRPTEVQAAFGLHQLTKLSAFNARRDELAGRFFKFIDGTEFLSRPQASELARPAWFTLPVMVQPDAPFSRGELTAYLEAQGIETRPIVAGNLVKQPAARLFPVFQGRSYPGADAIHQRGFYLGLSPIQSNVCMDRLLETMDAFLRRYSGSAGRISRAA